MERIDIEHVNAINAEWRRLNSLNLKEIDLYENGQKIEVSEKDKDEWRFTGLGLIGFVETEFYKGGWEKE